MLNIQNTQFMENLNPDLNETTEQAQVEKGPQKIHISAKEWNEQEMIESEQLKNLWEELFRYSKPLERPDALDEGTQVLYQLEEGKRFAEIRAWRLKKSKANLEEEKFYIHNDYKDIQGDSIMIVQHDASVQNEAGKHSALANMKVSNRKFFKYPNFSLISKIALYLRMTYKSKNY